ncbi:MAG TPA: ABC transporter permease, partial [Acidimicrobiia bacterium]
MTAVTTEPAAVAPVHTRATPDERRASIVGYSLLAMAVVVLWVFALGVPAEATSTFNLSLPTDYFKDLSWTFNTRAVNLIIAALIAVLGVLCLRRRWLERTNAMLGAGLGLLVFAFLAWAAADGSFSLVGMLRSTVIASIVITLGALCGLMCERAGVVNIGIEGQLLSGAFVAVILSSAYGTWAGVVGAMVVGALLGLLLVWLAIR